MNAEPSEIKACCAASYGQDAVALLLSECHHPGGLALTRRLALALGLRAGQRVVDVAAGRGASARLLAAEYAVTVDGVELGESTVERARSATVAAGLSGSVRFHLGDAERLPLPDAIADAGLGDAVLGYLALARRAVADELIGYRMLVTEKPARMGRSQPELKDIRHG